MTPELRARYAEPHRRYHSLSHIEDCLGELEAVPGLTADERLTLEQALWWHDAVYDPTRTDNEAQSATLAERELAEIGATDEQRAEVSRLILLTRGHAVEPGDKLGALMISIDLAILGRRPADYDRYAAQIRQEYAHVPEPLYRAGRAAVMRRFLEAETIYPDPAFAARFEVEARANIAREIAALEA